MLMSKLTLACLGIAAALTAQETPSAPIRFDAEAHMTWALSSLTKVTDQRMGQGLGIGVTLPSPFSAAQCSGFRLGLAANRFPGKLRQTAQTSLKNVQFTADVLFPSWWKDTVWFLGISANRYSATNSGHETWVVDPVGGYYMYPVDTFSVRSKDTKGVRGGLRFGFETRFSRHLSATLVFQQTELTQRITEPVDSDSGLYSESYPVNPSWIETGIRYTF